MTAITSIENARNLSTRILYTAYPVMPVGKSSAGGAEQVLATVEAEMNSRGYRTTIAGCSGSKAAGSVYSTGHPCSGSMNSAYEVEKRHADRILELISVRSMIGREFALIHDHSGSFFTQAHRTDLPVLATLHLPRAFYPRKAFQNVPANVYFNCVSESQAAEFADLPRMLGHVSNGIRLEDFPLVTQKKKYLLWLGRICEEKGTHLALDLARALAMPIVVAGDVFPFAYHQSYFRREVDWRLQRCTGYVTFVKAPSLEAKVKLIQEAQCLFIPSTAAETSSLVAMEAAACGTPVVAFSRGALPDIVKHGVTGWVSRNTWPEAAILVLQSDLISPQMCSDYAARHFSARQMADGYERLYRRILDAKTSWRAQAA